MKQLKTLILALIIPFISYAQEETVTIAECEIDTTVNEYDKLLKYFLVEKEEVKRLWKANMVEWAQFHPSISFEQNLGYWSSFELDFLIEPAYKKYNDKEFEFILLNSELLLSDIEAKYTNIQLNLEYRCYITKKRRERLGKTTNGFSGSFLFVGGGIAFDDKRTNNPISQEHNRTASNKVEIIENTMQNYYGYDFSYNFKSGLGYQRRLGKIGYIELKCGIRYRFFQDYKFTQNIGYFNDQLYFRDTALEALPELSTEFAPFIDINMGFALKSLKRSQFK